MARDYIIKTLNHHTFPSYQPMKYDPESKKHSPLMDTSGSAYNTAHFYNKKEAKQFVEGHRKKYGEGHDTAALGEGKLIGE
jgi:hypothetical protein